MNFLFTFVIMEVPYTLNGRSLTVQVQQCYNYVKYKVNAIVDMNFLLTFEVHTLYLPATFPTPGHALAHPESAFH